MIGTSLGPYKIIEQHAGHASWSRRAIASAWLFIANWRMEQQLELAVPGVGDGMNVGAFSAEQARSGLQGALTVLEEVGA